MPVGSSINDDIRLKPIYGPPKPWSIVGGEVGGMAGPLVRDLIALVGVSLSGYTEVFMTYDYTTRVSKCLGVSAGFTMGIVSHMQHPNKLMGFYQSKHTGDANVSIGIKAGSLQKFCQPHGVPDCNRYPRYNQSRNRNVRRPQGRRPIRSASLRVKIAIRWRTDRPNRPARLDLLNLFKSVTEG